MEVLRGLHTWTHRGIHSDVCTHTLGLGSPFPAPAGPISPSPLRPTHQRPLFLLPGSLDPATGVAAALVRAEPSGSVHFTGVQEVGSLPGRPPWNGPQDLEDTLPSLSKACSQSHEVRGSSKFSG
jgi:hypothetical protein